MSRWPNGSLRRDRQLLLAKVKNADRQDWYIFINIIHALLIFHIKYAYGTGNQNTCKQGSCDLTYLVHSLICYALPLIFEKLSGIRVLWKTPIIFVLHMHPCCQNVLFLSKQYWKYTTKMIFHNNMVFLIFGSFSHYTVACHLNRHSSEPTDMHYQISLLLLS